MRIRSIRMGSRRVGNAWRIAIRQFATSAAVSFVAEETMEAI